MQEGPIAGYDYWSEIPEGVRNVIFGYFDSEKKSLFGRVNKASYPIKISFITKQSNEARKRLSNLLNHFEDCSDWTRKFLEAKFWSGKGQFSDLRNLCAKLRLQLTFRDLKTHKDIALSDAKFVALALSDSALFPYTSRIVYEILRISKQTQASERFIQALIKGMADENVTEAIVKIFRDLTPEDRSSLLKHLKKEIFEHELQMFQTALKVMSELSPYFTLQEYEEYIKPIIEFFIKSFYAQMIDVPTIVKIFQNIKEVEQTKVLQRLFEASDNPDVTLTCVYAIEVMGQIYPFIKSEQHREEIVVQFKCKISSEGELNPDVCLEAIRAMGEISPHITFLQCDEALMKDLAEKSKVSDFHHDVFGTISKMAVHLTSKQCEEWLTPLILGLEEEDIGLTEAESEAIEKLSKRLTPESIQKLKERLQELIPLIFVNDDYGICKIRAIGKLSHFFEDDYLGVISDLLKFTKSSRQMIRTAVLDAFRSFAVWLKPSQCSEVFLLLKKTLAKKRAIRGSIDREVILEMMVEIFDKLTSSQKKEMIALLKDKMTERPYLVMLKEAKRYSKEYNLSVHAKSVLIAIQKIFPRLPRATRLELIDLIVENFIRNRYYDVQIIRAALPLIREAFLDLSEDLQSEIRDYWKYLVNGDYSEGNYSKNYLRVNAIDGVSSDWAVMKEKIDVMALKSPEHNVLSDEFKKCLEEMIEVLRVLPDDPMDCSL